MVSERIWALQVANDVFPTAVENAREFFYHIDGDVGFAMLDLLDVPLAQLNEVGELGLG